MQNYFYRDKSGKEIGPLNLTTLAQLRFAGVLNDETQVRSTDSDKWVPCREIVAVQSTSAPPPSQPIHVAKQKSFLPPVLIGLAVIGVLLCGGAIIYKSIAAKTALTYGIYEDGKELPRDQKPDVKVDGQLFESGNHLKPGRHDISVRLENVEPYERHFWLFFGTKDLGNLPLETSKGSLAVTVKPSPATVLVQRGGATVNQGSAPLNVEKLPVGSYTLIVKRGVYQETHTIAIQRQQKAETNIELNLGIADLSVEPAGADYEMSGNGHHWQGKLPVRVEDVPVGDYSLSVTRQGWELASNVSVVRGTITTNRTEFPYGSIEVTSKPTGLVVSTNGVEIGKTPITLQELKPAFYNLTVSDGENDLMAQIHVGPKENAKHDFAFRYGMVQLTTTPPGATVVRKGREVGKTPVTLEHIPAGESAIELRLAGYVFTNFAFVGVADTTTSYTVSLVSEQYLADLSEARRAAAGSQPDYSVALAKIAEALKIYPDNADALQLQKDYQFGQTLNEASALLAKGDLDQASTKIEVALALKPSDEKAIAVKQQIAGAKAQRDRVAKEEAARQAIEQAKEAARQSDEKANEAGQMFQQHIANVTDLVTRNPFSMGGKPFAFRTQTWRVHTSPSQAETAMLDACQLCSPVWQVESKAQPLSGATEYHLRQKVLLGSSFEKLEVQICELPNKDVDIRANLVLVIMPDNDPNHPAQMRQLGAGYFTTFISHFSHALQSDPLAQTRQVNSPPTYEQRRIVTQPGVNDNY